MGTPIFSDTPLLESVAVWQTTTDVSPGSVRALLYSGYSPGDDAFQLYTDFLTPDGGAVPGSFIDDYINAINPITTSTTVPIQTTSTTEPIQTTGTTEAGSSTTEFTSTEAGSSTTEFTSTEAGSSTTEFTSTEAGSSTTEFTSTEAGSSTTEFTSTEAGSSTTTSNTTLPTTSTTTSNTTLPTTSTTTLPTTSEAIQTTAFTTSTTTTGPTIPNFLRFQQSTVTPTIQFMGVNQLTGDLYLIDRYTGIIYKQAFGTSSEVVFYDKDDTFKQGDNRTISVTFDSENMYIIKLGLPYLYVLSLSGLPDQTPTELNPLGNSGLFSVAFGAGTYYIATLQENSIYATSNPVTEPWTQLPNVTINVTLVFQYLFCDASGDLYYNDNTGIYKYSNGIQTTLISTSGLFYFCLDNSNNNIWYIDSSANLHLYVNAIGADTLVVVNPPEINNVNADIFLAIYNSILYIGLINTSIIYSANLDTLTVYISTTSSSTTTSTSTTSTSTTIAPTTLALSYVQQTLPYNVHYIKTNPLTGDLYLFSSLGIIYKQAPGTTTQTVFFNKPDGPGSTNTVFRKDGNLGKSIAFDSQNMYVINNISDSVFLYILSLSGPPDQTPTQIAPPLRDLSEARNGEPINFIAFVEPNIYYVGTMFSKFLFRSTNILAPDEEWEELTDILLNSENSDSIPSFFEDSGNLYYGDISNKRIYRYRDGVETLVREFPQSISRFVLDNNNSFWFFFERINNVLQPLTKYNIATNEFTVFNDLTELVLSRNFSCAIFDSTLLFCPDVSNKKNLYGFPLETPTTSTSTTSTSTTVAPTTVALSYVQRTLPYNVHFVKTNPLTGDLYLFDSNGFIYKQTPGSTTQTVFFNKRRSVNNPRTFFIKEGDNGKCIAFDNQNMYVINEIFGVAYLYIVSLSGPPDQTPTRIDTPLLALTQDIGLSPPNFIAFIEPYYYIGTRNGRNLFRSNNLLAPDAEWEEVTGLFVGKDPNSDLTIFEDSGNLYYIDSLNSIYRFRDGVETLVVALPQRIRRFFLDNNNNFWFFFDNFNANIDPLLTKYNIATGEYTVFNDLNERMISRYFSCAIIDSTLIFCPSSEGNKLYILPLETPTTSTTIEPTTSTSTTSTSTTIAPTTVGLSHVRQTLPYNVHFIKTNPLTGDLYLFTRPGLIYKQAAGTTTQTVFFNKLMGSSTVLSRRSEFGKSVAFDYQNMYVINIYAPVLYVLSLSGPPDQTPTQITPLMNLSGERGLGSVDFIAFVDNTYYVGFRYNNNALFRSTSISAPDEEWVEETGILVNNQGSSRGTLFEDSGNFYYSDISEKRIYRYRNGIETLVGDFTQSIISRFVIDNNNNLWVFFEGSGNIPLTKYNITTNEFTVFNDLGDDILTQYFSSTIFDSTLIFCPDISSGNTLYVFPSNAPTTSTTIEPTTSTSTTSTSTTIAPTTVALSYVRQLLPYDVHYIKTNPRTGDLYLFTYMGEIYKQAAGTTTQTVFFALTEDQEFARSSDQGKSIAFDNLNMYIVNIGSSYIYILSLSGPPDQIPTRIIQSFSIRFIAFIEPNIYYAGNLFDRKRIYKSNDPSVQTGWVLLTDILVNKQPNSSATIFEDSGYLYYNDSLNRIWRYKDGVETIVSELQQSINQFFLDNNNNFWFCYEPASSNIDSPLAKYNIATGVVTFFNDLTERMISRYFSCAIFGSTLIFCPYSGENKLYILPLETPTTSTSTTSTSTTIAPTTVGLSHVRQTLPYNVHFVKTNPLTGDLYIIAVNGEIYKQAAGTTTQTVFFNKRTSPTSLTTVLKRDLENGKSIAFDHQNMYVLNIYFSLYLYILSLSGPPDQTPTRINRPLLTMGQNRNGELIDFIAFVEPNTYYAGYSYGKFLFRSTSMSAPDEEWEEITNILVNSEPPNSAPVFFEDSGNLYYGDITKKRIYRNRDGVETLVHEFPREIARFVIDNNNNFWFCYKPASSNIGEPLNKYNIATNEFTVFSDLNSSILSSNFFSSAIFDSTLIFCPDGGTGNTLYIFPLDTPTTSTESPLQTTGSNVIPAARTGFLNRPFRNKNTNPLRGSSVITNAIIEPTTTVRQKQQPRRNPIPRVSDPILSFWFAWVVCRQQDLDVVSGPSRVYLLPSKMLHDTVNNTYSITRGINSSLQFYTTYFTEVSQITSLNPVVSSDPDYITFPVINQINIYPLFSCVLPSSSLTELVLASRNGVPYTPPVLSQLYTGGFADIGAVLINCLLKGTKVKTINGYTLIEDLKKGDFVISHTGRIVRVVKTVFWNIKWSDIVYNESNKVYKIPAGKYGCTETVFISHWHQILINGSLVCAKDAGLPLATENEVGSEFTFYHVHVNDFANNHLVVNGNCIVESWSGELPNEPVQPLKYAENGFNRNKILNLWKKTSSGLKRAIPKFLKNI